MKKRAVFLDRDGTLIEDRGYIHRVNQIKLLPGIVEALRALQDMGYLLIVISNQSGVGRGFMTEAAVEQVNAALSNRLTDHGIVIKHFYYCPHAPSAMCDCRKPKPGLLLRAAKELGIDLSKSYMVGDKWSDVQAGLAAGAKPVFANPHRIVPKGWTNPVIAVGSVLEFTKMLRGGPS